MNEMNVTAALELWRVNVEGDTLACGFAEDFACLNELSAELDDMALQLRSGDSSAATDAFFKELEFGTAGLRGVIGAGTNRMNIYTVARATQGLADYLNAHFENPSVAIARDSRHKGELFVSTAASVLAANGICVYIYPRVEPTPALSFAVRDLGCSAGINMTASHNPAAYNGYKVYGPDGCQITSVAAAEISEAIKRLSYFAGNDAPCAKTEDFNQAIAKGRISWIEEATLNHFVDAVLEQSQESPEESKEALSVLYTPLCGTGLECVSQVLSKIGISHVDVVAGQDRPNGDFPTCEYPNPEQRDALDAGIAQCRAAKAAGKPYDLLLATDPDADRVGVACEDGDDYVLITGNEMGILLMDFIARKKLARGENLSQSVAVTTIVSSAMADAIAQEYGFELRRVLTGFKYIGSLIGDLEATGEAERFMFGFEESYGYLVGTHVRDKDAVVASMLICQMARYWKAQGKTLVAAMQDLYARYGWWLNRTVSVSFPGADGDARMKDIMTQLRSASPEQIAGCAVLGCTDYISDDTGLPSADVIEFRLQGDAKLIVRPSGTEPKIKLYLFSKGTSQIEAEGILDELEAAGRALLS